MNVDIEVAEVRRLLGIFRSIGRIWKQKPTEAKGQTANFGTPEKEKP